MRCEIVCIGTSWGGLHALKTLVGGLPAALPMAVVVVQHRHRDSGAVLADLLQEMSALPVHEIEDKQPVTVGEIHVAPANYHLLLDAGHFSLTVDEPVRFSRPSIDMTFGSVADEYGPRAAGVVLTGANQDGAEGLLRIVERGGRAIIQDPDTADSPIMPAAALRAVPGATRLPLSDIAKHLVHLAADDTAGVATIGVTAARPELAPRPEGGP